MSLLQNDFKAVLEHCSQISSIKADVTAMKLMMSPKIPETKTETESKVEIDEHPVNYETETESEAEIGERPVNYDADSDSSSTTSAGNSNEDDDEYDANFPPITNDQKKPKSLIKNG